MFEIGSSLAEARLRQGIELAKVEAGTRIRARYLEALEHERFEVLPEGPYRRSFLLEYAEFLGLDGEIYAAEYDRRFRAPEPELPAAPPPRPLRPALRRPAVALGGVALVALVAGLALWLSGSGSSGHRPGAAARGTTAGATTQPAPTQHASTKPAGGGTSAARAPMLVLRAARGSCWLAVRVGGRSGPIAYEGTLAAGASVRFRVRGALWIRLGAPWNVEAMIARRSLTSELPARTGDVLVTAAGLQPTAA